MKVAVLLTLLVGLVLVVLAVLQHFHNLITGDHVAIAFAIIGVIVLFLGAWMTLARNS